MAYLTLVEAVELGCGSVSSSNGVVKDVSVERSNNERLRVAKASLMDAFKTQSDSRHFGFLTVWSPREQVEVQLRFLKPIAYFCLYLDPPP